MLALIIVAAVGVGVAVYAVVSKPPPAKGPALRLPSISNLKGLVSGAQSCPPSIYPPGAEFRYEFCSSSDTPIGWRRCSTVTYSIDSAEAPAGYRADRDEAIRSLAGATGLHLIQVGKSGNITISWDSSLFDPRPGTSGEAGVTEFHTTTDLSGARASGATIRISSHLVAGSANGTGEEPILLHELGHAVGLAHFDGPVVMNPLDRGFSSYQPGDLAGLAALYRPGSC